MFKAVVPGFIGWLVFCILPSSFIVSLIFILTLIYSASALYALGRNQV